MGEPFGPDLAPNPEESLPAAVPEAGGIAGEAMRKALQRMQRMGESGGGAVQGSESSKRLPEKPASSFFSQESSKTSPVKPAPSLFAQVEEVQSTGQQQRQQQQQQQQQNQPSDPQTGATPVAAKH